MTSTTHLLQGVNQMNTYSKKIDEQFEEENRADSQSSEEKKEVKKKPTWKQPRATHDSWPQKVKATRKLTEDLATNLQSRMQAIRDGKKTTKEDYNLRKDVRQQKLNLEDLQKLINEYEVLISHDDTDYAKVFTR